MVHKAENIYFLAPIPRGEIHSLETLIYILKKNPTDLLMKRTKKRRERKGKEGERESVLLLS